MPTIVKDRATIVRDRGELEKLEGSSFFKIFSTYDHNGKIGYLGNVFGAYFRGEEPPHYPDGGDEFTEGLHKALGLSGIWAILSTVEGSGTQSCKRYYTIVDVVEETDMILNNEEYRKSVRTELASNPMFYEMLKDKEQRAE